MIFEGLPDAPSTAHGARCAAATDLRRSRCCDGAAQTSSVALILRVASATALILQKARHAGQGRQRARATARATRPVRAYATHLAEGIEANGSSRVLARLRCMYRSITFGLVTKLELHKIHVAKATFI